MIGKLPVGWTATRTTLQNYAQALTAFPRAAADPHPRWSHVAMKPTDRGFATQPVVLADGASLRATLDLVDHQILIDAADGRRRYDMVLGPPPSVVGLAMTQMAADHGPDLAVDTMRFSDTEDQVYSPAHAEAFFVSAGAVLEAMDRVNTGLVGEVEGPHLWPHGFDIATEWYSDTAVSRNAEDATVQIATGWYPSEDSYVYVNPWPFGDGLVDDPLPHGARWHTNGWQGAELGVPADGLEGSALIDLARAVHQLVDVQLGS